MEVCRNIATVSKGQMVAGVSFLGLLSLVSSLVRIKVACVWEEETQVQLKSQQVIYYRTVGNFHWSKISRKCVQTLQKKGF